MSAVDSPRPLPISRGFSKLETLPEGFAERMRSEVSPGDIIGERYKIISALGGGAMGQIFLAENVAIGLRVAVKLLKPELLANPDFRLRFKHEAEAVAAIQHPNVARFLDLVVDDPTFLVIELVEGPTLADVIAKEGALAPRRVAEIASRLCWGLHAAHKAGVIHRDLKPANILLQPDDETGEVPKIIDFGLAKLAATTKGAPLTRVGQIIGTPEYMAPEQIGSKDVDQRADVYALGCVIYAMLTGRPPFHGSADDVQVLYRQVHEPPQPVTRYALHVGAELEAVVMRALAKSPDERWQSMRELAEALKPFVKPGERPPSLPGVHEETQVVSRIRPRRNRWPWVVALGVAAAAGLGASRMQRSGPNTLALVITDPPGASIELDGKPLSEVTPAALHSLDPGSHRLTLRRAHFGDVTRYVQLDAGKRVTVQLSLPPQQHSVEVNTVPDGATLYLDGHLVAHRTPVTIEVSDDEYHLLRIEKEGYETVEHKLKPEETGPLPRMLLEQERRPRGSVFVEAAVPAEVWIDDQYSGFMTPTPGLRLGAGEHKIELRSASGALGESLKTRVAAGQTLRLSLRGPKAGK